RSAHHAGVGGAVGERVQHLQVARRARRVRSKHQVAVAIEPGLAKVVKRQDRTPAGAAVAKGDPLSAEIVEAADAAGSRPRIAGGRPLKKRRTGLGANRLAGVLRMAATSVQRSKPALGASFRRIARRKGGAVAVFATARQLARLIYRMLRYGHDYVDIGETAYDRRFQIRRLVALTETAKTLGYTLVPNVAAG